MVAITVAISSGVASMVPIERLRTFCSVPWVSPICFARSITLSWPTLVDRRTKAQLIEPAVECSRVCSPFSAPSAELFGSWSTGTPGNCDGTAHGSVPSTWSLGE